MRHSSLAICLCICAAQALPAQEADESRPAARARPLQRLFARLADAPARPVVIRVHESAFPARRVDTVRPVKKMVLGSHVTGTSRTIGQVNVDVNAGEDHATFAVAFAGRTQTRTVGRSGPACIYSHGQTDFTVRRRVAFSPVEGFWSEPTVVQSRTRIVLDGVEATKPGLRGRIIRRVAWRRANEMRAASEAIAYRDTRRDLQTAFDRSLDARVARMNERMNTARYVRAVLGDREKLDVKVDSTEHFVQFALGPKGETSDEAVAVLEEPFGDLPMEIWVHAAAFKERRPVLAETFALITNQTRPITATLPILQAISWDPAQPAEGVSIRLSGDWFVLGLDPRDPPGAGATAHRSPGARR